jgi:hypothetical protein
MADGSGCDCSAGVALIVISVRAALGMRTIHALVDAAPVEME